MSTIQTGNGNSTNAVDVEVILGNSPLLPSQLAKDATSFGISQLVISTNQANAQKTSSSWDSITASSEALGVDATTLARERCYLLMLVLDDSGSMSGHESAVLAGATTFIEQFKKGRSSGAIHSDVLIAVGTLNKGLILPYTEVQKFNLNDLKTFNAGGGTPLYDVTNAALMLQIAKTVELMSNGIQAKTLTMLMTDASDCGSRLGSAQVKPMISGLSEKHGNNHIVSGLYVGNAKQGIFEDMGLKPEWILKSALDAASLIDTFSRLSKNSIQVMAGGPKRDVVTTDDVLRG
jgi:uncharacterized protein YegL